LHALGAAGVIGALAACIVLAATAPTRSLIEDAAARPSIVAAEK
jgi:hypothetical protein